jgi:hypothetical protein
MAWLNVGSRVLRILNYKHSGFLTYCFNLFLAYLMSHINKTKNVVTMSIFELNHCSSYVASHHLAVAPQSGAKDQIYCKVYNITFN